MTKLLLVTFALFVALCVAWIVWPGRFVRNVPAPLSSPSRHASDKAWGDAPSNAAVSRRVALGGSTSSGAASTNTVDQVVVTSREGFTIRAIELAAADGSWRKVELKESALPRGVLAAATSLRAAGHRPIAIDSTANEIVLDADAMLTIEGASTECPPTIATWSCEAASPADGALPIYCAEQLDASRFAIAVTCDTVKGTGAASLTFVNSWASGLVSEIHFRTTPGARGRATLPCREPVAFLPVSVHFEGAPSIPIEDLSVSLAESRPGKDQSGWEFGGSGLEQFAWGTMWTVAEDANMRTKFRTVYTGEVVFDGAPSGSRLVLTASDSATRAWTVESFVNDGSPRRFTLHAPVVLSGRIVSKDGSIWTRSPVIDWTQRHDDGDKPAWRTQASLAASKSRWLRIDSDGHFEVRGPIEFLDQGDHGDIVPPLVTVSIKARGFVTWTKQFTMDAAGTIDCGVIEMSEPPADLRVLLDGTVTEPLVAESREVVLAWEDGTCQVAIIRRLRTSETVLELLVSGTSSSSTATRTWSRGGVVRLEELHADRAVRFLTSPKGFDLRGFTRVAPGTFRAVPSATYDVTFERVSDSTELRTGVSWMDIPEEQAAGWRLRPGTHESTTRIVAPETGMRAWWFWEEEGAPPYQVPSLRSASWPAIQPGVSRIVIPDEPHRK
jgi:hypothetical protein